MTEADTILFPYIKEPDTDSLMPSMSVGGAAINAKIKQIVAARRQGIIRTPNHPTYKRLFVERVAIVAVIFENRVEKVRRDERD